MVEFITTSADSISCGRYKMLRLVAFSEMPLIEKILAFHDCGVDDKGDPYMYGPRNLVNGLTQWKYAGMTRIPAYYIHKSIASFQLDSKGSIVGAVFTCGTGKEQITRVYINPWHYIEHRTKNNKFMSVDGLIEFKNPLAWLYMEMRPNRQEFGRIVKITLDGKAMLAKDSVYTKKWKEVKIPAEIRKMVLNSWMIYQ